MKDGAEIAIGAMHSEFVVPITPIPSSIINDQKLSPAAWISEALVDCVFQNCWQKGGGSWLQCKHRNMMSSSEMFMSLLVTNVCYNLSYVVVHAELSQQQ